MDSKASTGSFEVLGSFEVVDLAEGEQGAVATAPPPASAPPAAAPSASANPSAADTQLAPEAVPAPASLTRAPAAVEAPPLLGLLGGLFGAGSSPPRPAPAAASAADAAGGPGTSAAADPIAEFENAAAAAMDELGKKAGEAAQEAKESLSHLAQGISSWFAGLPAAKERGRSGGSGSAAQSQLDVLGLEAGEAVLESFSCQLLQTYTCTSNTFTPVQTIPFGGRLHITSARVCFVVDAGQEGTSGAAIAPIKIPVAEVKSVTKLPAAQGLPERIVVDLAAAKETLTLAHFTLKDLELDSALALLEHLASS